MRRFFSADSALPLLDVHAVRRRRGRLDSAENSAALTKQLFRQCGVAAGLTYTRYACALAPGLDGKIIGAQERADALIQEKISRRAKLDRHLVLVENHRRTRTGGRLARTKNLSPREAGSAPCLDGKIIGAQAAAVQRLIFQAATGFA